MEALLLHFYVLETTEEEEHEFPELVFVSNEELGQFINADLVLEFVKECFIEVVTNQVDLLRVNLVQEPMIAHLIAIILLRDIENPPVLFKLDNRVFRIFA